MESKRRVSVRDDYRSNVHEHLAHLHHKQRLCDLDGSAVSLYNSLLFLPPPLSPSFFITKHIYALHELRRYSMRRCT